VVGILLLVALVLVTLSFREGDDGPVSRAQNGAAAVLRPFQVAADRIAEPFRDAYGWVDSLFDARSDAESLRQENEALRQQVVQAQLAQRENARLRELLQFRDGPRLPDGFQGLAAAVISRPAGATPRRSSSRRAGTTVSGSTTRSSPPTASSGRSAASARAPLGCGS
jgi:rod shape-determining protein MreC